MSLRIWIVKYGEVIPFVPGREGAHHFRSAELTRRLNTRGHSVTWWTGRFEHQTKQHLNVAGNTIDIAGDSKSSVRLLDSPGYSSNLSIKRFYDHHVIGRNFRRAIEDAQRPDVIVASMPTPELARASVEYSGKFGIPLIVDVRDMWPDIFSDRIASRLGYFPKWLLRPYEISVKTALAAADSVTAITSDFLQWSQQKGSRSAAQCARDRVFHLASRSPVLDGTRMAELDGKWQGRGLRPGTKRIFVWAGTLTDQLAARALLEAQHLLSESTRNQIQLVICGKGDLEGRVKKLAAELPHVIFAGFVSRDEVQYVYSKSEVGLLCYDNTPDFKMSFPNKFGEYLANGLSVLTTVKGAMQREYGNGGFIETVDPNPGAIAQAITKRLECAQDANSSVNSQAAFRKDFDSDIVYEAFCDHIEQIATRAYALNDAKTGKRHDH
jgi:hypothetical protein